MIREITVADAAALEGTSHPQSHWGQLVRGQLRALGRAGVQRGRTTLRDALAVRVKSV